MARLARFTAAYLGLGAVGAMGLSSSAAMLMATKSAIPPSLFAVSVLIPLTRTLFLWQSITLTAVLIIGSVLVAYLSAPSAENARTAADYGIEFQPTAGATVSRNRSAASLTLIEWKSRDWCIRKKTSSRHIDLARSYLGLFRG